MLTPETFLQNCQAGFGRCEQLFWGKQYLYLIPLRNNVIFNLKETYFELSMNSEKYLKRSRGFGFDVYSCLFHIFSENTLVVKIVPI